MNRSPLQQLSKHLRSRAKYCYNSSQLIMPTPRCSIRNIISIPTVTVRIKTHHASHHHRLHRLPATRTKYTSSKQIKKYTNKPSSSSSSQTSNKSKYIIISLTTFLALNAFGTYVHFHDHLFHYYPLPFAIDMGMGPSMIPTLTPDRNELYLRDVWSHRSIITDGRGRKYQRGDVVTMYNPYSRNIVTKRIVGVEGDVIPVCGEFATKFCGRDGGGRDDGGVPVDGRFDPPFCQTIQNDQGFNLETTMKVPPNHVWVEGDNPLESTDSRHYGPLPLSALRGRIVLRLWPLTKEGGFSWISQERPSPLQK